MNVTKVTYYEVDYNELDSSITEFLKSKEIPLPRDGYECVCENEWGNDEQHSVTVISKVPSKHDMSSLIRGELAWHQETILNWMCAEGLIDPGEYLISVSW